MENLNKTYDPKDFEKRIYEKWEKANAFRVEIDKTKVPFTIMMPPPNITGQLHMGHALDQTLQDVLIRYKRMKDFNALWVPGSDHASIATEVKVVEKIREEEGKSKDDLGREEFLKRAWDWKKEYGGLITEQLRRLGTSCDWSRERFTMDEGCNKAVTETFIRLYNKGLIYRGNRLINWCPSCMTTLSDAEVEHEEVNAKYYYVRYPGADGSEGIVVATSRPETMFGDVAVAVHPKDERYKDFIGKKVILPTTDRQIPIISDIYPDPEKGTGAVKITPAHDPNDFEVGQRNDLDSPTCINFDATMNSLAGKYEGMDRFECRKSVVKELEAKGLLIKVEDKQIPIGGCYRCDTVVEPMLSVQWFVKMEELAAPAIKVAKDGTLKHVPERFEKIYLHWLENIRDWCISRQLWWGHRIPAYFCNTCGELMVSATFPDKCTKCNSTDLRQDEDVLDTWFSSALWPFSTLGWPENTPELEQFYPTSVLITGYDIIFFWVVRMVFSGLAMMGESPFEYVYIHGLVRDGEGRKMSKSLGNGIDPLEMIDRYGSDALRFMLTTGISPGNDMRFKTDKIEAARNFANKLWNASRFVIMNLDEEDAVLDLMKKNDLVYKDEDKWIISTINDAVKEVTANMDKFEFALAGQKVYELIWNEYCDWYIEIVKSRLYGDDKADREMCLLVLISSLKSMLKMLHPFMPFITEEIWGFLPGVDGFLMNEKMPEYSENNEYKYEVEKLNIAMETIGAIRNIRAEAEAAPSKKLPALILATGKKKEQLEGSIRYLQTLANLTEITFITSKKDVPSDVMSAVISGAEIFIPLDQLVDYAFEMERVTKEKNRIEGEVKRIEGKLSNEGFTSKAPEKVIDDERAKLSNYKDMLLKINERIESISNKL